MSASCDISQFVKSLGALKPKVMDAARTAVNRAGEHILGQAMKLAPVDTGALKASGTALPAEIVGDDVKKVIGFNTEYAAAVHERLDLHHDQGQAKFLETAIRQNQQRFADYVRSEMEKAKNS